MRPQNSIDLKRWFAVQVKPRLERTVAQLLRGKGYEEFLPVHSVRHKWSDRIKQIEEPVFPGYVFCRFDPMERLPILVTPGIKAIVSIAKTPCPIPDEEIDAMQTIVNSGSELQKWAYLDVGQRITVDGGPLRGLEGIIIAVKNEYRLVVSVTLLRRSVAVELRPEWISRSAASPVRQPPQTALYSHFSLSDDRISK